MTRAVRFLALALVFSLVGSAMAQPEDSEGRPKRGPGERGERGERGPGGPGGFRRGPGGPGGFGGGPGMDLIGNRQIHDELDLSDEQRDEIREIMEKSRESMRGDFEGLRDLSREERREKMEELGKKMEASREETQKKVSGVLLDHQKKRLQEIRVQMMGPRALADKEVSTALGLSDDQKAKIKEINESLLKKMRDSDRNLDGRADRDEDRENFRERFEKLRKDIDTEVMAVLTSDQKTKLEEMKGKKFELQPPPRRGEGDGFRRGRGEGRGDGEKGGKSRGERRSRDRAPAESESK